MISAKYYASALSSKKNYSHASLSHLMTLQTLRSKGTIPYTKIGHKIWYLKRDIERILRSNYIMFNLRERYGDDIWPSGSTSQNKLGRWHLCTHTTTILPRSNCNESHRKGLRNYPQPLRRGRSIPTRLVHQKWSQCQAQWRNRIPPWRVQCNSWRREDRRLWV